MKIRRIILKGVRNFTDFDRSFEDSWTSEVSESLLLVGPNGSGKSTILNVIAALWQILYDFLEENERPPETSFNMTSGSAVFNTTAGSPTISGEKGKLPDRRFFDLLAESKLAAIEIQGFLNSPNFWIFAGNNPSIVDKFIHEFSSELRIGRLYQREKSSDLTEIVDTFHEPGNLDAQITDALEVYPEWYTNWRDNLVQNVYGSQHNLPNIVYLESETRILQSVKFIGGMTPEPDEFQWLARYEPTTSRKGSLQNYLFAQKAVNPVLFNDLIKQVNSFFNGKKLTEFSPKTYQMMVQVGNQKHTIEELSSGEKQIILMLVTVVRRLEEGGIVMIDEPDLHLHVSLVNAFVSHLRKMISEKKGQLILASHAPELWRMFNEGELVRLGKLANQEDGE